MLLHVGVLLLLYLLLLLLHLLVLLLMMLLLLMLRWHVLLNMLLLHHGSLYSWIDSSDAANSCNGTNPHCWRFLMHCRHQLITMHSTHIAIMMLLIGILLWVGTWRPNTHHPTLVRLARSWQFIIRA